MEEFAFHLHVGPRGSERPHGVRDPTFAASQAKVRKQRNSNPQVGLGDCLLSGSGEADPNSQDRAPGLPFAI